MALFITSKALARRHGVYAIERTPPAVIKATGTGTCAIVGQFPWGPSQVLTEATSTSDLINTLAPPGMSRTGSGYLSIIRKGFPRIKFVRVLGTSAAAASAILASSTPTNIITVTLKCKGTAGNAVTATVAPASDGDANHFNLTVAVTGVTGTTFDFIQNLNYSGTGADSVPDLSKCFLIGSIVKDASGVPAAGTTAFSGGTDGTVLSSDYVGTAGAPDKGISLLERDKSIDHFFTDDPGGGNDSNSLRKAVNDGLVAHANRMTDRTAYVNGPQGQALADVTADVNRYRSEHVCYVDSWAYILDDTDGTKRLVPPAAFAASVAAQLPPSTSIAWKSPEVQALLSGIVGLEFDRGDAAATNTDNGVVTLIQEETGGFTFEAGVNTLNPVDPTRGTLNRTRMGHFLARSVVSSLRSYVDAPNVPSVQQDELIAVDNFLSKLKKAAAVDPAHNTHILDYAIDNVSAFNAQDDLNAGEFTIPASVQISPSQAKIFLSLQFGETVKVSVS